MGVKPTGTIAFLFTDVQGSTRLWEKDDRVMAAALERHDDIVRATVAEHGGYVFSTAGDAFATAFGSCAAAASAASDLQERLTSTSWPTSEPVAVRIGLHVGEAHERDGDYFGPTVNRAARVMAAAHGGQTLATAALAEMIGTESLKDLGRHRLKDLQSPEHMWQLDDGEHPPLRTLDALRHNLPVERTSLVGRTDDVSRLAELLEDHRLVTVLGIGGTGKSRVATAAAAHVADRYPDGVWFVDLVPVTDAPGVATAIAGVTGLRVRGPDVVAGLAALLASKRALFVVDNCEHVTDAVAEVVDDLLGRTSEPRFLATSRGPLELFDEAMMLLDALDASERWSPAVELFLAAADRIDRRPPDDELDEVAAICAHLDGHPLSIELAAAQLQQLSVGQLAQRLNHRFELLQRRSRGRRHESLLAILEDTWNLLTEAERRMLVQLAAFPSSFSVDEVDIVCADVDVGLPSRTLGALVAHNLVVADGDDRQRLLETIKLFARRRWADETALDRHERWMFDRLRAEPHQNRYISRSLGLWLVAHTADWQAIERRLAMQRRWERLGELYLTSHMLFNSTLSGPWSIDALARIEQRLADNDDMVPSCRAALHLTAAQLGLPTRRADWIDRGARVAVELMSDTPGVELAYALVLRSWSVVLTDAPAAVDMLDEAFVLAEEHGAPGVADVALGYQANHLALARRAEEAREVLARLRRRLQPGEPTYGQRLHDHVANALNIVRDPPRAVEAADALMTTGEVSSVLAAATFAASGDLRRGFELFELGISQVEELYGDDGFPDLLIPLAAAAFATDDTDRARRLLTAIRHSPKLTQNFLATIQYRELRDRIGVDVDDPFERQSMQEIFDEARAWFEAASSI